MTMTYDDEGSPSYPDLVDQIEDDANPRGSRSRAPLVPAVSWSRPVPLAPLRGPTSRTRTSATRTEALVSRHG